MKVKGARVSGRVFSEITLSDILELGYKLGKLFPSRSVIVSGRDYSPISRMFKRALTASLMNVGIEVMDFHESTTGEIAFCIKRFGASGGFNVLLDPSSEDHAMIRIFRSPGYEVIGEELRRVIEADIGDAGHAVKEVGWVTYAEYIHKLYAGALSSFVRADIISERSLRVVANPGGGPADIILREFSSSMNLESILISSPYRFKSYLYPMLEELEKTAVISSSIGATLGVVFNNDATSISIYNSSTGYLLPEEVAVLLARRLPTESKIYLGGPVIGEYIDVLKSMGYDVLVLRSEEELIERTRKDRPVLSITSLGEAIVPTFSLGYDSLALFVMLLEAIAMNMSTPFEDIRKIREKHVAGAVAVERGKKICEEAERAPWGCREGDRSLLFSPQHRGFLVLE